jgi:hypothetical protein
MLEDARGFVHHLLALGDDVGAQQGCVAVDDCPASIHRMLEVGLSD